MVLRFGIVQDLELYKIWNCTRFGIAHLFSYMYIFKKKGIPKALLIISVGENKNNKFTEHFFIKTAFAWLTSYKLTDIKRKQLNINCIM